MKLLVISTEFIVICNKLIFFIYTKDMIINITIINGFHFVVYILLLSNILKSNIIYRDERFRLVIFRKLWYTNQYTTTKSKCWLWYQTYSILIEYILNHLKILMIINVFKDVLFLNRILNLLLLVEILQDHLFIISTETNKTKQESIIQT